MGQHLRKLCNQSQLSMTILQDQIHIASCSGWSNKVERITNILKLVKLLDQELFYILKFNILKSMFGRVDNYLEELSTLPNMC